MTLKTKVIGITVIFGVLFCLLMTGITAGFFFGEIESVERFRTEITLQNAVRQLKQRMEVLSRTVADYATWDDTYFFTLQRNPGYVSSNLALSTFLNTRTNYFLLVDQPGNALLTMGYDLKSQVAIPIPDTVLQQFATGSALLTKAPGDKKEGIIMDRDRPLMFAARPVLPSLGEGTPAGTLVMARYLDQEEIAMISDTMQTNLSVIPLNGISSIPPQDKQALAAIPAESKSTTRVINTETIAGYTIVADAFGKDAFLLKETKHRDYYDLAGKTLYRNLVVMIGMIGLMVVTLYWLIHHTILQRLTAVTEQVSRIGKEADFSKRVAVGGKDELSGLAQTVNRLLDSLRETQGNFREKSIQLAEKVTQIEQNNVDLERTKKAMLNVLEDERELQDQLLFQRDQAQAILRSVGEGLTVVDPKGVVVLMNPTAASLLQLEVSESVGKPWVNLISLMKGDTVLAQEQWLWSQAVQHRKTMVGQPQEDYWYKLASGERFPVAIIVTPLIVNDSVKGAVIAFRDITREKQERQIIEQEVASRTAELVEKNSALEQARTQISEGWLLLQREKARLTASIQSLPVGFVLTDMQENILIINPSAMKIFGFTTPPQRFSEIELAMEAQCDLHMCLTQGRQSKSGIRLKEIEFRNRHLDIFLTPIFITLDNRDYIGSAMLINDITEAKMVDRSKDEFFSIASHELRTPLTAIRGNTSMILDYFVDKISDPSFREMVEDIHASSIRLIALVSDFLDVSRLEQKRFIFQQEQFAVLPQLEAAIHDLEPLLKEKQLTMALKPVPESLIVTADKNRTKQVLLNLIGNAIKYSEHGTITVWAEDNGSQVEIFVGDTGRGIPPAGQLLLFRKFQQAEANLYTRDATRGTGLGLYISKLMVEGMHGTIRLVKSEAGIGSVFSFTLPKEADGV